MINDRVMYEKGARQGKEEEEEHVRDRGKDTQGGRVMISGGDTQGEWCIKWVRGGEGGN